MSQFHDKRACTKCGYVRRVVVNVWKDGRTGLDGEHWNKLCTICDLISRAEIHRRAARIFEERAVRMRLRRNMMAAARAKKRGAA